MAAVAAHGVRFKVGKNLREIRSHLCQHSVSSQEVRDFTEKDYVQLKKANCNIPILICECFQVQPKLWVFYAFGQKNVSLNNLISEQMATALVNVINSKAEVSGKH
ncbi:NADH dehydrogenase [ubiquinone] 1 alpha subcomplex subunit 2-like [Trichosurus vulpecula]|uniref:NADH dehydrogenase [ubiquinone] 1 alpha subcomplex subunit 2-like n=1 Tax=Trichosurus vulpecula TaxID=9337 RepID=UPI00186AF158|nr:NADH dehydrogenase [ubiquinone] 1 alpha subcomplex subunit 2-like [Trichosurus vulpecula]